MGMILNDVLVPDKDLNQRFAKTFIEIKTPISEFPFIVFVSEFTSKKLYFKTRDEDNHFLQEEITITREFPKLGAIEYGSTVHYLSRLPLRQWSRGFQRGIISDFCRGTPTKFTHSLGFLQAHATFYPRYTPHEEGLIEIKTGKTIAFAHNDRFWFSGNKNRTYLWLEDVPIGEVVEDTLFFNRECSILKQEVKDEFNNVLKIFD